MKEKYNELKQKFNLPEFEKLDHEFEISSIEEEHFILRRIREKMLEHIETTIKMFDGILQPDTDIASMKESGSMDNEDREKIIKVYKRLMYHKRIITELYFEDSDEKNRSFIHDFYNEWLMLKKDTLKIVDKLKSSWENETEKKEVVRYLG